MILQWISARQIHQRYYVRLHDESLLIFCMFRSPFDRKKSLTSVLLDWGCIVTMPGHYSVGSWDQDESSSLCQHCGCWCPGASSSSASTVLTSTLQYPGSIIITPANYWMCSWGCGGSLSALLLLMPWCQLGTRASASKIVTAILSDT